MKQLNPLSASRHIHETYARYLQTLYPISDPELREQFKHLVFDREQLVKGPYLEATPPYKAGRSINDLMAEGVLSPMFSQLEGEHLPLARPLYKHQEEAIRKIVKGRNLIVATGTGSGKTETFLIPILNHLLEEKRHGTLSDGVRALLLYPMNALANDQMKRLREMLVRCEFITFGRYTGETKQKRTEAEEDFRQNHKGEPSKNELLSRDDMQSRPPHILLTNYAMLEYLLLRPRDSVFFDGPHARSWKFLVLDEVHTYDGAKGIETAMLIRRLKDRITQSKRGRIQCIGTSATLGGGRSDFPDVVKFGQQLFDEPFDWDDSDISKQDVIAASRISMDEYPPDWGAPEPCFYIEAQQMLGSNGVDIDKLARLAIKRGFPQNEVERATQISYLSSSHLSLQRFLYELLKSDANLKKLRESLIAPSGTGAKPMLLTDAATMLFGDYAESLRAVAAMVNLASQAKSDVEDAPLLPARYHLFVKAMEGGFAAFAPQKKFFLNRQKEIQVNEAAFPVFEIAPCKRCGAIHLVGEIDDSLGSGKLQQSQKLTEENRERAEFFLLKERLLDVDDEDEEIAEPETVDSSTDQDYSLCLRCAAISRNGARGELCGCDKKWHRVLIKASNDEGAVTRCRSCGARGRNLVHRFLTGQDAPVSVLATALYQEIPERETAAAQSSDDEYDNEAPRQARKLLIFSDSRQDAAYFAPYLGEITYLPILWRRLIVLALEKHQREMIENGWRISDLVEPLRRFAQDSGALDERMSRQQQLSETWKWLLLELIAQDRRNSLEGLGLARFLIVKPDNWGVGQSYSRSLAQLLCDAPLGLDEDEIWTLYQILLDSFRLQSVIAFPDSVSPDDEIFAPRNRAYYFREERASPKKHIFSWASPSQGKMNRRVDFIQKLLSRCANENGGERAKEILRHIWESFMKAPAWKAYFGQNSIQGEGIAYQLGHDFWEIQPTLNSTTTHWFECDICGNLFSHNLRGVCPTYRCEGTLRECNIEKARGENHYRNLYLSLAPMRMICKEHTAQLSSDAASELQNKFVRGEVNVLSCSTTFELGVDVGSLESVLMRNVPPTAANYIQRAGRAGRRTDSTAFALTYCQRRSHDLAHFAEPERIIAGTIGPPRFEVRNEKIIRRHIQAVALAAFWKQHPDAFGKVKDFFFSMGDATLQSADEFYSTHPLRSFLEQKPQPLADSLRRILKDQHETFKIESWGWLDEFLLSRKEAALMKAADEIYSDIANLEAHRAELIQQGRPSDFILRTINTIQGKSIIDFLASRGVLPKYGFPVDVVELQLLHHGDEARRLELQRDLRIALSEYAPESQVVAGGRLWTSCALKRVPKREWLRYKYAICALCNCYQRVDAATDAELDRCASCDQPLRGRRVKSEFVIPEFGFVSSAREPLSPSAQKPQKTFATQVFYTNRYAKEDLSISVQFGDVPVQARAIVNGQLAVLNRAGFTICFACGYAKRLAGASTNRTRAATHRTPHGKACSGRLEGPFDLGHEFRTDVLRIDIAGHDASKEFWLSLLYAMLEGASQSLSVARNDLDGCLYPFKGNTHPSLVLFDNVPGGAGHVRRLAESEQAIRRMMEAARDRVDGRCGCGRETSGRKTSCYGCLQNYYNQFFHDELERGPAFDFLDRLARSRA